MSDTELKPCPHCGGPAKRYNTGRIVCADESMVCGGGYYLDAEAWNRRADTAQVEALKAVAPTLEPLYTRAAERICNLFANSYYDVNDKAGMFGEKHVPNVADVIREEITPSMFASLEAETYSAEVTKLRNELSALRIAFAEASHSAGPTTVHVDSLKARVAELEAEAVPLRQDAQKYRAALSYYQTIDPLVAEAARATGA